jgi:Tfp pilus assembly protein PilF
LDAGRPARAIEACTTALALDSVSADAFELRGVAYEDRKRLPEAIADYSAALRLRPGSGELLYNRGFARMRAGDAAGAVRDFGAALKSATLRDDPDLLLARATCQLALGKPKPARKDAARLVQVLEAEHQKLSREHAELPPRAARSFLAPLLRRLTEAKQLLAKIELE